MIPSKDFVEKTNYLNKNFSEFLKEFEMIVTLQNGDLLMPTNEFYYQIDESYTRRKRIYKFSDSFIDSYINLVNRFKDFGITLYWNFFKALDEEYFMNVEDSDYTIIGNKGSISIHFELRGGYNRSQKLMKAENGKFKLIPFFMPMQYKHEGQETIRFNWCSSP